MSIFNRKFLISILIIAALAVAGVVIATVSIIFYHISQDTPVEEFSKAVVEPSGNKYLGEKLTVYALFKCPWHRYPEVAELKAPDGLQVNGKAEIEMYGVGLTSCVWKVKFGAQPYRTGKIPASKMEVTFNEGKNPESPKSLTVAVPGLEIKPLPVGNSQELALAGKVEPETASGSTWYAWLIVAGLLFLLAIIYLYYRRGGAAERIILTPWSIALSELADLKNNLKSGKVKGEPCFSRLTDVVRIYLEKRFKLKAPQQTTDEFMQDLERPASPLNEHHRHFLKEFMTSADLVKFANLPADMHLLENALVKAEELVIETEPNREKK